MYELISPALLTLNSIGFLPYAEIVPQKTWSINSSKHTRKKHGMMILGFI